MFTFSPLQITLASAVSNVQQQIIEVQNQLSAGKRTLNAGENGIVTRLASQASAYDTSVKNITSAQSVLSVGSTTLTSMSSIATQLKNIATQGASAGLATSDRDSLATTFASLYSQLTTLSTAASINGNNIVNSATALTVKYDPTQSTFSMTGVDMPTAIAAATTSAAVADNTTFTQTLAGTIVTEMTTFLDAISTAQGSITSYSVALDAMTTGAKGVSASLNSTIDSIQNVDSTAMQAKLQSLNNQQSIDYYLVSQMNTESAAILAIFR